MNLKFYLQHQLNPSADDGLPVDAQSQIASPEISQKSLIQINAAIRGLQKTAQDAKGTPEYDNLQKAHSMKRFF